MRLAPGPPRPTILTDSLTQSSEFMAARKTRKSDDTDDLFSSAPSTPKQAAPKSKPAAKSATKSDGTYTAKDIELSRTSAKRW